MNKIEEIKKELEKNLGYNFNNWGKGDLQMLKEIINANDKVVKNLALCAVVKSLKDEDIPTFEEYTQNYGYKRIGNSNVYKNEGTYKDTETLLKEYKKEYCL